MLTALDDTLAHQLPTTFDHVGTSDPRFFDRYWFACYDRRGEAALQVTMGAYRNMDVLDAGIVVVHRGRQFNLRMSRPLGSEIRTECGPLQISVTRPLQEFTIAVAENAAGIRGELVWTSTQPAAEERPHFSRLRRRVTDDYQRFDQIGVAEGWMEIDGERLEVTNWWACRDHSWGVRPRMGVREPVTGPVLSLRDEGFLFAFLFFSTDEVVGHVQLSRRGDEAPYFTGDIRWLDSEERRDVVTVDLEVDLHPRSRRFRSCVLTAVPERGPAIRLECAAQGSAIAMQGLGYSGGFDDRAGLGAWRGDLHIEADVWDVSDPAEIVYGDGTSNQHWHRIQPVEVNVSGAGTSGTGTGSLTLLLSGRLPEFGLG